MYVETDALLNVRADIQSRGCGEKKKEKKRVACVSSSANTWQGKC